MAEIAIVLIGVLFSLIGLIVILKPEFYVKLAVWKTKVFLGAKLIPGKRTGNMFRVLGIIFLIIGLAMLYANLILGKS